MHTAFVHLLIAVTLESNLLAGHLKEDSEKQRRGNLFYVCVCVHVCIQPICCVQMCAIALSAWNTSESSGELFTSQKKNVFQVKSLAWNVKRSFCFSKVRFQSWRTERVWDLNKHCVSPKSKRKAPNPNLPALVSLPFCLKKLMRLKEVIDRLIFSPLVLQFWSVF